MIDYNTTIGKIICDDLSLMVTLAPPPPLDYRRQAQEPWLVLSS